MNYNRSKSKSTTFSRPSGSTENSKSKPLSIILGDSIVKHLQGRNMSKFSNVKVISIYGSTVEAKSHCFKLAIDEKPEQMILHVGTNTVPD